MYLLRQSGGQERLGPDQRPAMKILNASSKVASSFYILESVKIVA